MAITLVTVVVLFAQAADNELKGSFSAPNIYHNSALGLTIKFTAGQWRFFTKDEEQKAGIAQNVQANPNCNGPLCGSPQIKVALNSASFAPAAVFFLEGFKLGPQYLDRSRYPIRHFAEVMLTGSMDPSQGVPDGDLAKIKIDGRDLYRVTAHRPSNSVNPAKDAVALGYVAESNGYVFMIIATVPFSSDAPQLQSSIEHAQLKSHLP